MKQSTSLQVLSIAAAVMSLSLLASAQHQADDVLLAAYEPAGPQMYQSGPRFPRSILRDFAVDRMLKDKGFVRSIINCVLDKGPCESNGRKLRLMAPEILRGQCPGCSRTLHNQIRKVISHVQRNFPVEWSEVTRRFMSYNNPAAGQQYPQPVYNPDPNMYQQNMYG